MLRACCSSGEAAVGLAGGLEEAHLIPQGVLRHRLRGDFLFQGIGFPGQGPGAFFGLGIQDCIGGQEFLDLGQGRLFHRQGGPEGGHGYLEIFQVILRLAKLLLAVGQAGCQGLDFALQVHGALGQHLGQGFGG